ncbi:MULTISPECIES: fluoride efflux transporter CrcB [Sanguibacteroides]|uniref:Fluoride-specific ion channel FluC n=1 Tax=Sanguibacteroides justesenii TaxID=1547597 RepID=A0A0C3REB1_9PORP|nr:MULTISPECIES: fluoride efflux transporter CrcB [Sanguibacteroides]KIO43071.1 camphor resistance protein CrcB [Sanguibacteroides justesenii]KIO44786.1 camphor resistance protein CrcB [Sanguibacteroides justesenii]PXZ43417.1 fluoride efflux transporter CrcB [Sanguibacteroides justesenii]
MFKAMIIAGIGGFIGTCLRFLVGKLCHFVTTSPFPWGTFAVNIIGSFVIGIFFGLAEKNHLISTNMNVFLITGFCGGFTTFSSFADDMFLLIQNRHWLYFSLYLGLSIILGIILVWLGRSLIKAA